MRYFLDTEFNGFGGELISVALVAEDGRTLYMINAEKMEPIEWVSKNVMPLLYSLPKGVVPLLCSPAQMTRKLNEFLGGDEFPCVICDWPDDIRYFCWLLITGPGMMINIPSLNFEMLRVDPYPTKLLGAVQHNAIWDALALQLAESEL